MAAVSPVPGQAFSELYARHSRLVYAFCLKWLRTREEAEDAVQTTFMYAWRGLGRGVVPVSESAWIVAIARNVCRSASDARRRCAAELVRDPQLLEDAVAAAPAAAEDVASLSAALAELTELQRRAILMREWQGLSYNEIADDLGLTQSAVETLLFRARRSLVRKLRRVPTLVPWLKSLLGAGAVKLAAGATLAVLTAAVAGEAATHRSHTPRPRPRAQLGSTAAAQVTRVPRSVISAAPAGAVSDAAHVDPRAVPKESSEPAAQPAPSAPPAAPATAAPAAPAAPEATPTATVAAAADAVGDISNALVGTPTDAASTVGTTATDTAAAAADTVTDTASTAASTAQSAVATVTSALPPLTPTP